MSAPGAGGVCPAPTPIWVSIAAMLRNRVLTAVILAPLVLASIILVPVPYLSLIFWLLALGAGYEWAALAGRTSPSARAIFLVVLSVVIALLHAIPVLHAPFLYLVCVLWFAAAAMVLLYPRGSQVFSQAWSVGLVGLLMLSGLWVALVVIRQAPSGQWWLIWALFLVWAADIGAYFAGRALGRHKLAPAVSPGKTWEGAAGGLALALSVCLAGGYLLQGALPPWLLIVALIIVSIFGDLFESLLKRVVGVKDSGTLLPGHGGVLDRIDSLIAVAPFFALYLGIRSLWN